MRMWDRFDFKAVSLFSQNQERAREIKEEFKRVGLTDVIPFWSSPDPYSNILLSHVKRNRGCSDTYFFVTLKHRNIVRCALESGAKRALIFEDDIRFLNDLNLVERKLDRFPEDSDIVLLDWFRKDIGTNVKGDTLIKSSLESDACYVKFTGIDFRSSGAYSLSRKGMEWYLSNLELPAKSVSSLRTCDEYWRSVPTDGSLNSYVAVPQLCVQGCLGGRTSHSWMKSTYAAGGTNYSDYNIQEGA